MVKKSLEEKIPNDLTLPVFLYREYWDNENFRAGKTTFREILENARLNYKNGTWAKLFLKKTKSGTFKVKKESVALYIITHYLLIVTRETDRDTKTKVVYWYDPESGFWRPNARQKISQLCQLMLQKHKTIHYTREIIAHIEDYTLMTIEFNQDPHLLAVQNGILNLHTRELLPFNPRFLLTNGINVIYDPNAGCNHFLKFLNEILNSDYQLLIQELWGDIIFKEYRWQKIFFFYGGGRNGKGTLIRIIEKFLGEGNYACQYFHVLQKDKNARAELDGKYVNFAGDMSKRPLRDTNILKHLRGQEPMSARFLHENFFTFRNHAILIANCNKPPRIEDDTESWQHTVMLIRFDKKFVGKETDRDLVERLTTEKELSGILNWALDGLDRLFANGDYSETESGKDMFEQYKQVNSPVYAFASRYLDCPGLKSKKWSENVWICDDKVWRVFKWFCSDTGLEIPSRSSFTQELEKIFPKARRKRVRRGEVKNPSKDKRKEPLQTWLGLEFKESEIIDEDMELELDEDSTGGQTTLDNTIQTSEPSPPPIPNPAIITIREFFDTLSERSWKENDGSYSFASLYEIAQPTVKKEYLERILKLLLDDKYIHEPREGFYKHKFNWYHDVHGARGPFDLFMIAWNSFIEKNNGEKGISLQQIKDKFPHLTLSTIESDLKRLIMESKIFKPREGFFKPI